MELKEFIKDTVTQIADAVTELNGGTSKFNLVVNPIVSIGGITKVHYILEGKNVYLPI